MDDRLTELLSRSLDDDLDDVERAEFEHRLKTDSHLRSELDGTRRLRQTIVSIASGMEPPVELDRVMEPLRQGSPAPKRHVRPVYRWLAAAAAVVLGVTVTLEMARRNPSPTTVRPNRTVTANGDDREVFQLAPLPSAAPDENRPTGATEQLLEEQPPQPPAPEPSALEVVGPLTTDEFSIATDSAPPALEEDQVVGDDEIDSVESDSPGSRATLRQAEQSLSAAAGGRERAGGALSDRDRDRSPSTPSPAAVADPGKLKRTWGDLENRAIGRPTTVSIGGVAVWTGTTASCDVGRWPVVLDLRDGIIVDLGLAGESEEDEKSGICRPVELIGAVITDAPDGRVTAEIVVHQPPE